MLVALIEVHTVSYRDISVLDWMLIAIDLIAELLLHPHAFPLYLMHEFNLFVELLQFQYESVIKSQHEPAVQIAHLYGF